MYHAQERVEFFQSESSFDSESSLSNSRYFDFTNDIISETDNLFLTLKKQLLPNEQLSQQDKVKYALSRAQILYKDTIPEHIAYLNKIQAPANAKNQITVCSQKLEKLLTDYQSLRNKTMIYKQFFNIYGKEFGYSPEGNFVKGERVLCIEDENEAVLKPECIQINYNGSRAKLKATPRVFMAANPPQSDKQAAALREQVYLLKKNIEEIKRKHDLEITNEKLLTEKRIRTYLQAQTLDIKNQQDVKSQIEQYSFKLSCSQEENKTLKELIEQSRKTIDALRSQNASLREEVEMLRKRDINIEEENVHDKSYTSEVNEKQERKLQKKLKILLHENQLLKNQLKSERQKFYRLSSDLTDEEKKQLDRLKKQVEKKTQQLQQLYSNLDKQRIEILQLTHNIKTISKMNESIKSQNEEIKKQLKVSNKEPNLNLYPLPSANDMEVSLNISRKLQVLEYEGQGVQGLPYYEILNKEFKIRFRRACLKDKELLHKANGLQVGVITHFEKPNKMQFLIHLTNYGEASFKKVKGKLLNANQNKIGGQNFQYVELSPGDQVKVPVSWAINYYPLGPLILALEYQAEKREELRILLPAHIFKMMEFEELSEPITKPQKIQLSTQRKIVKNIEDIRQYVKVGRVEEGCLKLSAYHRHTHTEVHLDIRQTKEGVDISYQHYQGNINITEYFIRTFAFLIKK